MKNTNVYSLIVILILLVITLSSCIKVNTNVSETKYEKMIEYVAVLYNKGYNSSKATADSYIKNSYYLYPKQILGWYKYFSGSINEYPSFKTTQDSTELMNDYVKKFNVNDWEATDTIVDGIDYNAKDYPKYNFLVSKVKEILTKEDGKFWKNTKELYPDFTTEDASNLAGFIVSTAIKISNSFLTFSRNYNGTVFEEKVTINKNYIRPELLLAFAMTESSFRPFAYKLEENNEDKIYAASLGISQILADINLIKDEVGLTNVASLARRTFTILNQGYLSSKYNADDLFKVKVGELFNAIFVQLLFDKILRENWVN